MKATFSKRCCLRRWQSWKDCPLHLCGWRGVALPRAPSGMLLPWGLHQQPAIGCQGWYILLHCCLLLSTCRRLERRPKREPGRGSHPFPDFLQQGISPLLQLCCSRKQLTHREQRAKGSPWLCKCVCVIKMLLRLQRIAGCGCTTASRSEAERKSAALLSQSRAKAFALRGSKWRAVSPPPRHGRPSCGARPPSLLLVASFPCQRAKMQALYS